MNDSRSSAGLRRWVGIDEAGYGPNLGPLVMVAITAEGPASIGQPNIWLDLDRSVSRAGVAGDRLWVDDSKMVFRARKGLERLDAVACSIIGAVDHQIPATLGEYCEAVGAGTLVDVELARWLGPRDDSTYPPTSSRADVDRALSQRPFDGAPWSIIDVRAAIIGPRAFNDGLKRSPTGSKSDVHFAAFARLLEHVRASAPADFDVAIRGDKHGGRHFYGTALSSCFPGASVTSICEGPVKSLYEIDEDGQARVTVELIPRADAQDGLVALASIVAKSIREHWMEVFNRFWQGHVPGLKPSAGYPVDAARFRRDIESQPIAKGLDPSEWWRTK